MYFRFYSRLCLFLSSHHALSHTRLFFPTSICVSIDAVIEKCTCECLCGLYSSSYFSLLLSLSIHIHRNIFFLSLSLQTLESDYINALTIYVSLPLSPSLSPIPSLCPPQFVFLYLYTLSLWSDRVNASFVYFTCISLHLSLALSFILIFYVQSSTSISLSLMPSFRHDSFLKCCLLVRGRFTSISFHHKHPGAL